MAADPVRRPAHEDPLEAVSPAYFSAQNSLH